MDQLLEEYNDPFMATLRDISLNLSSPISKKVVTSR